jgi:hypothetical protein
MKTARDAQNRHFCTFVTGSKHFSMGKVGFDPNQPEFNFKNFLEISVAK